MNVKRFIVAILVVTLLTAVSAQAVDYDAADYILNATFDIPIADDDWNWETDHYGLSYRVAWTNGPSPLPVSEYFWDAPPGTWGAYFYDVCGLRPENPIEHTSYYVAGFRSRADNPCCGFGQPMLGLTLNDGDSISLSYYTRNAIAEIQDPGHPQELTSIPIDCYMIYDSEVYGLMTSPAAPLDNAWHRQEWSYTHSGSPLIEPWIAFKAPEGYNPHWLSLLDTITVDSTGRAKAPYPGDGGGANRDVVLSWRKGEGREEYAGWCADEHDVYLGTNEYAVRYADVNDVTGIYRGRDVAVVDPCDPDRFTYDPPEELILDRKYYWRIDEVNEAAVPIMFEGDVWEFTVRCVVDDMESYGDDNTPYEPGGAIYYVWRDGWEIGDPYVMLGNDTGSQVGHGDTPYSEETIVHSGGKSMPFYYENDGDTKLKPAEDFNNPDNPLDPYSEATAEISNLVIDPNWAMMETLRLYFYGDPGNDANDTERMYVALESATKVAVVKYDEAHGCDPNDVKQAEWHKWDIPLSEFTDVNLANIVKIHIGFGDRGEPAAGGKGIVYFDDIQLVLGVKVCAESPDPEDAEEDIDPLVALTLSWERPIYALDPRYDVYFGTTPGELDLVCENLDTESCIIPAVELDYDDQYYWRVDVTDGEDFCEGEIWSFFTIVPVCDPPMLGDVNGDCVVDFLDFAIMASEWLECHWVPVGACY